jgi:hypothetical protein
LKRAKKRPLPSARRQPGGTGFDAILRAKIIDGCRSRISGFGDANYFAAIRAGIKKRLLKDMELNAIADARSGQLIIKVKLEDL